jgi:hypothetical protein
MRLKLDTKDDEEEENDRVVKVQEEPLAKI